MMYINGQAVAPTNLIKEGHNFSTDEQVVGTWIDGKPLYEKTVVANSGFVAGNNNIAHLIDNLSETISVIGLTYANSGAAGYISRPINQNIGNDSYSTGIDYINDTNIVLWIGSGVISDNLISKAIFIIQYTKTTD